MGTPALGRVVDDVVATVRWPADPEGRARRDAQGRASLLVLEEGQPPPDHVGPLEDWTRAPLDPLELSTRLDGLRRRQQALRYGLTVDDDGLLRVRGQWVALTDVQQALIVPLLAQIGRPVPLDDVLAAYVAAGGQPDRRPLRRALSRLRGRVAALGVDVHLLSGRAVLLEPPRGQFT